MKTETNNKKLNRLASSAFEWIDSIVFSLTIVLLLFTFAVKTFIVQGSSMEPNFFTGDRVFALELMYEPQQGDVVVIDDNNKLNEPLIKRVVATEGQTVNIDMVTGVVTVDGIEFNSPIDTSSNNIRGDIEYPIVIPQGYVFVMGDNRAVSLDSRYSELGCVDVRSIVGKEIYTIKR